MSFLAQNESILTPENWNKINTLDLTKLKRMDTDGEHNLRSRLRHDEIR